MDNIREAIAKKVSHMFPQASLESITAILDLYGTEDWEREKERVHLGILKLSNGSLEELRACVATAKQDYRDILAYAEYPNQMRAGVTKLPLKQAKRMCDEDEQQLLEWLQDDK